MYRINETEFDVKYHPETNLYSLEIYDADGFTDHEYMDLGSVEELIHTLSEHGLETDEELITDFVMMSHSTSYGDDGEETDEDDWYDKPSSMFSFDDGEEDEDY
jgi:hypothetical protein